MRCLIVNFSAVSNAFENGTTTARNCESNAFFSEFKITAFFSAEKNQKAVYRTHMLQD